MKKKRKNMEKNEAEDYLMKRFNLTREVANDKVVSIQLSSRDQWVSQPANYLTLLQNCTKEGTVLHCLAVDNKREITRDFLINLQTMEIFFETEQGKGYPASFVYTIDNNVTQQTFTENAVSSSLILYPIIDLLQNLEWE